ncbi:MAG: VanZ family protein [Alphaproteobacteria bacterium]
MQSRRAEIVDWALLAALVAVVYATLGLARRIFDAIERAGLEGAVRIGVVAVILALAVAALVWMIGVARIRRVGVYLQFAALGAAYAIILLTLSEMPVERIHLLEYGAVGLLAYRALRRRFAGTDQTVLAVLITLNVGLGDELLQGLLPRRFYDTKDVLVNTLAGLLGVLVAVLLTRGREREGAEQT